MRLRVRQPRFVTTEQARRIPQEIRVAVTARDADRLGGLLTESGIERHLQEVGETILSLLEHDRVVGARPALTLAALLTERGWTGDADLADLLLEQAGDRSPQRRRVRADLDELADLLEGSLEMGFGGVLDCETGDVWPEAVLDDWDGDDAPDPDEHPDRYLFIPNEGSRDAWEDMRDFAVGVEDETIRDQLLDAIDGRGAFSRFKRVLDRHDDQRARWYSYSAECRAGRARDWLAGAGYSALPPQR
jgi:hypothetical protein